MRNTILAIVTVALLAVPNLAKADPFQDFVNGVVTWLNALTGHVVSLHERLVTVENSPAPPSDIFRFVGFTDETTNALADTIVGTQGMIAMNALCQDDFGPNSRMCLSKEFWRSPNAAAPAAHAWVHSSFVGFSDVTLMGSDPADFTCNGWDGGIAGLTVTTSGKSKIALCSFARPVTCCALVQ